MKLNVFGYIGGDLGYNILTQGFIEGCSMNGIDVIACPQDPQLPKELSNIIKSALSKNFEPNAPSIQIGHGDDMYRFSGKKRIGLSAWDTTKLPDGWVQSLNTLDEVWTVSNFSKKVFHNSGVEKDIKVVNEGVDTTIFNPYVNKLLPMRAYFQDRFVFFSVFKWRSRKSPEILLKAFTEEFGPDEKVALAMQCWNPFVQGFNPYKLMFDMNLGKHAEIVLLPPTNNRMELARYYVTSDCFVLPSKGEAWGLQNIEAMASGLPVITTRFGGPEDYLKEDYGWFIDVEKMEKPCKSEFADFNFEYPGNEWAVPSLKHLKELMRYAFEHDDECKKKGFSAYNYVDENYTLEETTKKVKEMIE